MGVPCFVITLPLAPSRTRDLAEEAAKKYTDTISADYWAVRRVIGTDTWNSLEFTYYKKEDAQRACNVIAETYGESVAAEEKIDFVRDEHLPKCCMCRVETTELWSCDSCDEYSMCHDCLLSHVCESMNDETLAEQVELFEAASAAGASYSN
jgi:hypothetical protein